MDLSEKLISIAENEQRAADANAQLEQILYGTDTGGKSYYDLFWDELQDSGNRKHYESVFRNWNCEEIIPKYPLTTSTANNMFSGNKSLKSCPPIVPTTDTIIYYNCFSNCKSLVEIDFDIRPSNLSTALASTFYGCFKLITI